MSHPLDVNYELLKAQLDHLDRTQPEFKTIERYLQSTQPVWRKLEIMDVWSVNREGEVRVAHIL